MKVEPPPRTSFDLHFRLLGVPIRIHPLFWLSAALLGAPYLSDPEHGSFAFFAFWMAVVFVSVLLHEFGHVLAGRLFGLRSSIVLAGLGGLTTGIDSLPRFGQRLLVLLAGAFVHILILAGVWGIAGTTFPTVFFEWEWQRAIPTALSLVVLVNLYWGLFNLLPLWPLDGGRILCDLGESLLGRRGRILALILCLASSGLSAIGIVGWLNLLLPLYRYDPRFVVVLEQYGVLLLFCFLIWLRTFRALWPEEPASPEPSNPPAGSAVLK